MIRIECDGPTEVLRRLFEVAKISTGLPPQPIAERETTVVCQGAIEIANCGHRALLGKLDARAATKRFGLAGRQFHRLVKVVQGMTNLAETHHGGGAIVVGSHVAGRQNQCPVEILHGLRRDPETKQQTAAVVVGRRVLGKQAQSLVEILQRPLRLTEPGIDDGTIGHDRTLAVVGELFVLERFSVELNGRAQLALRERPSGFARLYQALKIVHGQSRRKTHN